MGILRSQNKITDFFMILAWTSPFKRGGSLSTGCRADRGHRSGEGGPSEVDIMNQ